MPLTPGTTIDILARLYADRLSRSPRPAGRGAEPPRRRRRSSARRAVANAAPDGYTLLFANSGHAILGLLNKNLPFDPIRDFAGVSWSATAPAIVVVPASLGVSNLKEFVALAKAKPGDDQLRLGRHRHLDASRRRLFRGADRHRHRACSLHGEREDHRGHARAARIQASFDPLAFVLSFLQNGRLRALAVGAEEPITDPLAIPTAVSQGVDYQYATWYGILAPAKTPKPILRKLSEAISDVGQDAELQAKIWAQAIDPRDLPLEKFDQTILADMARLDPLLKAIAEHR